MGPNDNSKYQGGNIHEGEYVPLPSRPFPISRSTGTPTPELPQSQLGELSLNQGNDSSAAFEESLIAEGKEEETREETAAASWAVAVPAGSSKVGAPEFVHKWTHAYSILCVIAAPSKNLLACGTQDSKILLFDMDDYSLKQEIACGSQNHSSAILCLALSGDENFLFSGGSDSLVKVWDLSGYSQSEDDGISERSSERGNKESEIEESQIPSTSVVEIHCTHIVYSLVDIGDIFSIAWSDELSTLFIGAQCAAILWTTISLSPERAGSGTTNSGANTSKIERLPHYRYDKFFDSKGPGGSVNLLQTKQQRLKDTEVSAVPPRKRTKLVEIANDDIIRFSHNGYVYCMELFNCATQVQTNDFLHKYREDYDNVLITCGGDGMVKFWGTTTDAESNKLVLKSIESLDSQDSILSMAISDSYIYAGLSNSTVNVWDLTTLQLIRSFCYDNETSGTGADKHDEVLSIGIHNNCIFKASNRGGLSKLRLKNHLAKSAIYEEVRIDERTASSGDFNKCEPVLAVKIFTSKTGATYLLSGGDKSLCLWDISTVDVVLEDLYLQEGSTASSNSSLFGENTPSLQRSIPDSHFDNEHLLKVLQRFISYKTISRYPAHYIEDSRHCAQFLTKLLIGFGASHTKLLAVENGNPIVYSTFSRNTEVDENSEKAKRILWYAHYDVVDATRRDAWATDPFSLTAKDGNLYGRGVSDNKGPTLAAIFAVAELFHRKELSVDVVFIIEGEEECGSIGFQDVINTHKPLIGDIDWVMLSNSYWLDDEIPCLNYGLRGVINASITIKSEKPDRHSGVDGGVSKEPTMDLIQIISKLINPKDGKVSIPGFYDDVLPITKQEIEIYEKIEKAVLKKGMNNQDLKSLLAKWRNPSLTVHKIEVSGPNNNTVIPQTASASISIRVVPNQELVKIKSSLIEFLEDHFAELDSENELSVNIFHEAEPWLGDPSNLVYQILFDKIRKNWGPQVPEPLFIREGGSIPSIRFLEKCFNAPAAQIPCGQASDNAHLKDEKLRVLNLYKLRNVLTDSLRELGSK
ncbi:probable di- and tripeptidase Dug2p [[Candida] anglica]|uniref:Probable di- and tripeptidase Dug2p n=1 Tax=[Candida] anglica TaxID=148631 RepID=A0ABP0E8Z1_9ASCO